MAGDNALGPRAELGDFVEVSWRRAAPRKRHRTAKTRRAMSATLVAVTTIVQARRARARSDALRDVIGVAPGLLPFGIALGVVVASTRMGDLAGFLGAPLVYAGSAQLTATILFQQGAGLLAVVGSAAIVNARLLLYSASLAPRFTDQPAWFRLLAPHFIIDPTFVAASARRQHDGRDFRRYWLVLGIGVMAVWSAAVGLGVVVGPRLPALPHLALAGTAMFVGMVMPRIQDRPSLAAALTGALVAPLVAQIAPAAGVIAGTAAGVLAGLISRKDASR
jgi:predicted branched-subunit amino acid permease